MSKALILEAQGLTLVPKTHEQEARQDGACSSAAQGLKDGRWRQVGPWSLVASQPGTFQASERPCLKKKTKKQNEVKKRKNDGQNCPLASTQRLKGARGGQSSKSGLQRKPGLTK